MAIQKIQSETINEMEAKSVANIPDRPYDYGYTATEVKRAFIDPITAEEGSVVSEINRIVDEANAEIGAAVADIGDLDELTTTEDGTLVGAINEVKAEVGTKVNMAILTAVLAAKQNKLTFDSTPTYESSNPVTSNGIATELASKEDKSSVGDKATLETTEKGTIVGAINEVVGEVATISEALDGKQATLTFDEAPTASSTNPVTSGGVLTALTGKADLVDGKVPAAQLPSYVDDVLEYAGTAQFPVAGETGKIYVDAATNKTYRWSGSSYVEISESLALGETSATAYAGDKGKANADAIAALQTAVAGKQETLTFDNAPTENSGNAITSGAVKTAIDTLSSAIPFKTISTPSSSTLTNEEKAAIVAGAYIAEYDNNLNLVFFPANQVSINTDLNGSWFGTVIYSQASAREYIGQYIIDTSNVLIIKPALAVVSGNVDAFNGKKIPAYPFGTGTFVFEIVNGTLSWVEKPAQSVEDYTIATSSWSALSNTSPYTYSTTVTATHTIGNDTVIELINDQAVLFAKHGFAIGAVSGQSVTIYSIGVPDASVTLEVAYNG